MTLTTSLKKACALLDQFSFREKIIFFWASIVYRLYKTVPKSFFESRDLFEYFYENNGKVIRAGNENVVSVLLNEVSIHILLRRNTSDIPVFNQVFRQQEYLPIVKLFKEKNYEMLTMIDAGSNIGLTSLFFLSYFPKLKILAVEPNKANYNQLGKNIKLSCNTSVIPLLAGVWYKKTFLAPNYEYGDKRHWAFSLKEKRNVDDELIECFALQDLISDFGFPKIDFLKVDVEGAEDMIFLNEEPPEFLNVVNCVAIEIHNKEKVGEYLKIFEKYGFEYFFSGELICAYKKNFI